MQNFRPSFRSFCLFSTAAAFSLTSAHAAAICGPGTAASYVALGSTGCQEGNLLFNNFAYTPTANPAVLAVPSSGSPLSPLSTGLSRALLCLRTLTSAPALMAPLLLR